MVTEVSKKILKQSIREMRARMKTINKRLQWVETDLKKSEASGEVTIESLEFWGKLFASDITCFADLLKIQNQKV